MSSYLSAPTWQNKHPFFNHAAPRILQPWLTDRNSLTHALICACPKKFTVQVLNENWQRPTLNESKALGLKLNSLAFIRQVHLYCGDQAWVYARTVVPAHTLRGELQKLTHLGTQPLGAVLFANKHIQRGDIEISRITNKHKIHKAALMYSKEKSADIWARRSLFQIGNSPLIVNEVFLPEMDKVQKTCN